MKKFLNKIIEAIEDYIDNKDAVKLEKEDVGDAVGFREIIKKRKERKK